MSKEVQKKETKQAISFRKSCNPQGTGLSHYIIVDNKKEKVK